MSQNPKKKAIKKTAKPKPCQCLEVINKRLAEQRSNTRVDSVDVINFSTGKMRSTARITVVRNDPKNRETLQAIVPTYCPFCGQKYSA